MKIVRFMEVTNESLAVLLKGISGLHEIIKMLEKKIETQEKRIKKLESYLKLN